jgi:glycosyltransferase involved in cell wall biosynthesis
LDGNTAVLVKPDDAESLKAGIASLLDDVELGVRLAGGAYEKVADYTWDKRAERIFKFIS